MTRVLIVGLDGATFSVIDPLVREGRLPHLKALLEEGAWGTLQSTYPPITPTAWTSFFTGKSPGKHGLFDFQEIDRQTYEHRSVRSDRHNEKSVWQLLGEAGHRCMVIDVPFTFPPKPMNGYLIAGYGAPRTEHAPIGFPADLRERLPAGLQEEVRVALPQRAFDRSQAFIDEWQEIMRGRERLLQHLAVNEAWQFFMVVFSITDNLGHVFWPYVDPAHPNYHKPEGAGYREAFFAAYERCDELLGKMMKWSGEETTTLVMSDHGFGSVRPRQFMFQHLAEGGFLKYQQTTSSPLAGDWLRRAMIRLYNGAPYLRDWVKSLRPERQDRIRSALLKRGLMPSSQSLDPERTLVIPANYGLQVWVNDKGRFSRGPVEPREKSALLEQVREHLLASRDPVTGEPVFKNVHRGTEIYKGPAARDAPDLVAEHTDFYRPEEPATEPRPHLDGGHSMDGVFLARGPHVRAGRIEDMSLIDIAPTVLHLFGLPIPPDMDGHVVSEILSESHRRQYPIQIGTTPAIEKDQGGTSDSGYTPEQEAEIEKQLRELGYI